MASVAAGVNAMMLPITTCTICGLSALSFEARCKTFDASADGYGRGEAFSGENHTNLHNVVTWTLLCMPREDSL